MMSDHAGLVAQLRQQNRLLERELRTDDITGLGNLRALKEALGAREHASFGLLFIDIDYFKLVNEHHGHMAATGVLRDFGAMLAALVRPHGDLAFRYAGDEFVVILDSGVDQMAERAEVIRRCVEHRLFKVDGHQGKSSVHITVSIGCRSRRATDTVDQILADADKALFEAKRKSRNVSVAYHA